MHPNPYQQFQDRELSLGDFLAIDRTVLANERTALAYGRTFLAMLVIGGSCIKFFDAWYMMITGLLFIAASFAVAVLGGRRFRRTQLYLAAALERRTGTPDHPLHEEISKQQGDGLEGGSSAPRADAR